VVERVRPPKSLLRKWEEEDREAREIRRRSADWDFIRRQPPRIKLALLLYIETGDVYKAAKIAGLTVDEFNEIRMRAKIPSVT